MELKLTSDSSVMSIVAINLANRSADNNSNLEIVCRSTGETLVLEVTNSTEQLTSVSTLMYTTAAYTLDEASQNPNNVYLPVGLLKLQL